MIFWVPQHSIITHGGVMREETGAQNLKLTALSHGAG
jgi:hypothetical protein